uniref:E3 ubiquitin-protein ligase ATL6-like n=1 Tax=Erigeron canadensis TaxID=72917 RepID=UPI001CB9B8CD|nr:E3 ubiquitin-protein ligase ATL6-like [Erigeron canadensis]
MNPMNNNNCSNTSTKCIFLLISLLLSFTFVKSQPTPPPDGYPYAKFSPSMAIIIVVLVAALFFMGFFSIYIRRCSNDGGSSIRGALSMHRAARLAAVSRGLSSEVLETFPTFAYSAVKGLKIGKGALECAVCLNEFDDEETIRLIPKCDHVFHAECIDAWLENHVTCPVCRSNLVPQPGEITQQQQLPNDLTHDETSNSQNPDGVTASDELDNINGLNSVSIPIDETPVLKRNQSAKPERAPRSNSVSRILEKFRSHSTGHSLVQPGENTDRFTLRLPDEIRKQMISNALLNRSGSTVRMPAGEGSTKKGYRTGEGSSKGRSYKRMGSLDRVTNRLDRWPSFLSRAFSVRPQKVVSDNAGPSTSTSTADDVPLNNVGPKSDDPGMKRPPV